ncbi:hypothetical protein BZL30_8657 [Mycobacterium kansasii]|uniref:Uncharacterized protein n=1 Tax=Mycobacterium kansasii TaxID=1768 RepID=A0A1V3WF05_MYCKA|nr:hypothetical protein BZL30_8657 [Mycobacterium kansasii]OOK67089.1 hypothetical protein BZL29_7210 [Mycobacterium kansasii]
MGKAHTRETGVTTRGEHPPRMHCRARTRPGTPARADIGRLIGNG